MIDRQGGKILFECDSCDDVFEGGEDEEFASAWARAKGEGWKAMKIADEWLHGCPRCGRSGPKGYLLGSEASHPHPLQAVAYRMRVCQHSETVLN